MPDIDLDSIEARAKVASAGRLNWQGIDALRSLVESDVPALVALVRAKQSWIDGAKVDMAAMEEERAKALAAIALAGEEIERASVEVKRADRQRDDARAAIARVRALHTYPGQDMCPVCVDDMLEPLPSPCPTLKALDGE